MNVHLHHQPEQKAIQTLEKSLDPSIQLSFGPEIPAPERIDVLVAGRPERSLLEKCTNLAILIIPWAGVPTQTKNLLQDFPSVDIYNLHHNAAPTAELAIALILAVAKQVLPFDKALRNHDWRPRYQPDQTLMLKEKKALIVGFGAIGRRIGMILKAFEMEVVGIRRHGSGDFEDGIRVHPPQKLDDLLPGAHLLVLSLPLTTETRGLIGKEQLLLLPEEAILVNISRGPIVDQQGLFEILQENKIAGAGLDVWYNYPDSQKERERTPPADYPFHTLDNVVLSPHRGGLSSAIELHRMAMLAESLNAAARGDSIPNPVNIQLGY